MEPKPLGGNKKLTLSIGQKRNNIAEPPATWLWKDDKEWKVFDKETTFELEQNYLKKQQMCKLTKGFFSGKSYVVYFTTMKQKNLDTGNERRVKRNVGDKKSPKIPISSGRATGNEFEDLCGSAFERNVKQFYTLIPFFSLEQLKSYRNNRDQTVLYCAALGGSVDITRKLISMKVNISGPQGPKNSTPLHAASWKGHAEVVAMLLFHGADPQLRNEMGLSAEEEAQGAAKLSWDVFNSEGNEGVKRFIPKRSGTLIISPKSCSDFPFTQTAEDTEIIVTLFNLENENAKMARWKFVQSVTKRDFDIPNSDLVIKILDTESVRVSIEFVQHVEKEVVTASTTVVQKVPVQVGNTELTLDLTDLDERQNKLDVDALNGKTFHISIHLRYKPFDDSLMKKWLAKQVKQPNNISETVLIQFYTKMKNAYSEFRSGQLKDTGKKAAVKAAMKKALQKGPAPEDKLESSEEYGILYPHILCTDFGRSWDNLELKTKIKHYIGFQIYSKPLHRYYEKNLHNDLSWKDYIELHIIPLNFILFFEEAQTRYHLPKELPMDSFCKIIVKSLEREKNLL